MLKDGAEVVLYSVRAGGRSSLSVKFYSRKSLVPTGERASIVLQVIVSTTKGFCVSKEPDPIHQVGEGLL